MSGYSACVVGDSRMHGGTDLGDPQVTACFIRIPRRDPVRCVGDVVCWLVRTAWSGGLK